jgi:hypothetical protein
MPGDKVIGHIIQGIADDLASEHPFLAIFNRERTVRFR